MNFMNKITVLGAGESGVGAALLAQAKNYSVFLSDNGKIEDSFKKELDNSGILYEEYQHSLKKILSSDLVIKSPGIPNHIPVIQEIEKKKIPIVSEIEFASRFVDGKIIAVTGTNGKTTTVSLIYHLLKKHGCDVELLGNIGKSFAREVASSSHDYYVLELSSFQLEGVDTFKADVALILNITPDHLDRYNNDMHAYGETKFRILNNQTEGDFFIYNEDDVLIKQLMSETSIISNQKSFSLISEDAHVYYANSKISLEDPKKILDTNLQKLKGEHNYMNIMASLLVTESLGFNPEESFHHLCDFECVEHRLEKVGTYGGVSYVNDSKATNVEAVKYALTSFDKDVILIAGGVDKGNDYNVIRDSIKKKVKKLIILGNKNISLLSFFGDLLSCTQVASMQEAVDLSKLIAKEGDTVLLSPACASFDLYQNYEERGRDFKTKVKEKIE